MTEKQYAKIGSIVVSLIFIVLIIWGYCTYNVVKIASITGMYYREVVGEMGEKWDVYLSFDSSDIDNKTFTYYYVQKSEEYLGFYAKMTGKYSGYEINRAIATLCYDPREKRVLFFPISYKPCNLTLYDSKFVGYDGFDNSISPEDIGVTIEDTNGVMLFSEHSLLIDDIEFTKISEMPSEYQFQFSIMGD